MSLCITFAVLAERSLFQETTFCVHMGFVFSWLMILLSKCYQPWHSTLAAEPTRYGYQVYTNFATKTCKCHAKYIKKSKDLWHIWVLSERGYGHGPMCVHCYNFEWGWEQGHECGHAYAVSDWLRVCHMAHSLPGPNRWPHPAHATTHDPTHCSNSLSSVWMRS